MNENIITITITLLSGYIATRILYLAIKGESFTLVPKKELGGEDD